MSNSETPASIPVTAQPARRGRLWFGLVLACLAGVASSASAQQACSDSNLEACNEAGVQADAAGEPRRAADLFEFACDRGHSLACSNLAEFYWDGRGRPQDSTRAGQLFGRACNDGVASGCAGVCVVSYGLIDNLLPEFHRACEQVLERSCQGGNRWMCAQQPLVPASLRPGTRQKHEASCRAGDSGACVSLGIANYSVGRFDRSLQYTKRSCELGEPMGCSNLGELMFAGEGTARDLDQAYRLFSGACEAGVDSGCAGMCLVLAERGQLGANRSEACLGNLASSCRGGNFWMCRRLKELSDRTPVVAARQTPPPAATPQPAAGCTAAERTAISRGLQQIYQLAASGNVQASLNVTVEMNRNLSAGCRQELQRSQPALPPGQRHRIGSGSRRRPPIDFKKEMIRDQIRHDLAKDNIYF